jgi:hypothetical protein
MSAIGERVGGAGVAPTKLKKNKHIIKSEKQHEIKAA